MKFIDEFRNKALVKALVKAIHNSSRKNVSIMEVCGGHTMAIHKFGIPYLLPSTINLLSGPGCPVCVTGRGYIDKAVAISRLSDVIITTYGDLIRVPGSSSSLDQEKGKGADIRIVLSTLEALKIARDNPHKKVVFLGIGFETTAPGTAAGILQASKEKLKNFYVLSSHKIMPPAMEALIDEGVQINGYIAPGHVSTITGAEMYNPIAQKLKLAVVISGFEPVDILQSVYMIIRQVEDGNPSVETQYKRVVHQEGNPKAKKMLDEVFYRGDDWWRGLGLLKNSGLRIKSKYERFDAEQVFEVEVEETREPKGCICGTVLKGLATPVDCKLFAEICTPENPVGACMVSNEGACHAYYKYKRS